MKAFILQLSDIHLIQYSNIILDRKNHLMDAIKNQIEDIKEVFIVVSGDVAFSGKDYEYENATELFNYLKLELQRYTEANITFVIIPGNHDCNFNHHKNSVRNVVIDSIIKSGSGNLDEAIISQCCELQENYFQFAELYNSNERLIYSHKLLNIFSFKLGDYSIRFNCYNSAWLSLLHEKPGQMMFPIDYFDKELFIRSSDLSISLIHHPFNWQNPVNSRDLKEHLEKTSDIILTGHEHVSTISAKDNLIDNYTEYIEGAVLQETGQDDVSGFNVIMIDFQKEEQKIITYDWKEDLYSITHEIDWFKYKRSKSSLGRSFKYKSSFLNFLNDPGAKFTHRQKLQDIQIDDLYIYPHLKDISLEKIKGDIADNSIQANFLFNLSDKKDIKLVIVGPESSGKTSFCKMACKFYNKSAYIPIYIKGELIRSTDTKEFIKIKNDLLLEQYHSLNKDHIAQLDKKRLVIIIDDFDKANLNKKYRSVFIKNIKTLYPNIIITGNDFMQIEELIYGDSESKSIFEDFKKYEIQEFGHLLRHELINKWNLLGRESIIEDDELIRKNDDAKRIIDEVVGKNFIPSYPIFLLTILQSIEANTSLNLDYSKYGYYYQFLINKSLGEVVKKDGDLDFYHNFLAEYCYFLFQNKFKDISIDSFKSFLDWYSKEYKTSYSLNEVTDNLNRAKIINLQDGTISIQYKYVYYFFVARYLTNNLHDADIKAKVIALCQRLYREEFSNVIMFLTHLSKDPFILEQLLENAKSIFNELNPLKLEDDIETINKLVGNIPKLVFENKDIEERRREELKHKDEIEEIDRRSNQNQETKEYDINEDLSNIDFISKLNLAFKTIEILGQILKKYAGSIKGVNKYKLAEATYFLGLRSLNVFFSILNSNTDSLVEDIKAALEKSKESNKDKLEEKSKKLLFHFCFLISNSFIRKIANSIGSPNLKETYEEILANNPYNSIRLIDVSIKLDFYQTFPINDIKALKTASTKNFLAYSLLREFVINHLYMFHVSLQRKQQICELLDIPMDKQRFIQNTTKKRK